VTAKRRSHGAFLGLLLLSGLACTETDEQLISNVGVTIVLVTDSGLLSQDVTTTKDRIQAADWDVVIGPLDQGVTQLDIDGALVDFLFGEPCFYFDTIEIPPFARGPCSGGVVIESSSTHSTSR